MNRYSGTLSLITLESYVTQCIGKLVEGNEGQANTQASQGRQAYLC